MLLVARFHTPRHAARVGWAIACLAPPWLAMVLGAAEINLRGVVAVIAITAIVVKPRQFAFPGFSWIDLVPVLIFVSAALSTTLNGKFSPSVIVGLFCQWVLPYVLARLILISDRDAIEIIPWAATVALILAVAMILESVTDINLFSKLLGHAESVQGETGHRFGLKRAEAWLSHPIYAGLFLALLSPWVFAQAYEAFCKRASRLWLLVPAIVGIGLLASLSRGPCIVFGGVIAGLVWHYVPPIRMLSIFAFVILIAVGYTMGPSLLHLAESVERPDGMQKIKVDGETYTYSGTRHRYLLFKVYEKPLAQVGWFGFGTWGSLPKHEAMLEPQLRQLFLSVDNHYLLHYLNTGIVGSVAFSLLPLGILLLFLRTRTVLSGTPEFLSVALISSLMASSVVLATVWMAEAFCFAFLLNAGFLVALLVASRRSDPPIVRTARPLRSQRFSRPRSAP
ncbi:hypothetical protein Pla52o_18770 [Novipirellula galeiformis]|uniref:O-Antigen ligase n=1 Tax=Novipirellula galeiformis TaxID=2528004 RepID=A0A5C6CKG4_9BACT|nr:hypothetical protein Pla52o_18770 [Novipirellula galeiformis]